MTDSTDSCEEHTEQLRSLRYNSSVHCNKKAKSSWFLTRLDIEKKTWWRKPPFKESHTSPTSNRVTVNIPLTPTLDLLRKDSAVAANGQHCTGPWEFGSKFAAVFSCDPRWVYEVQPLKKKIEPTSRNLTDFLVDPIHSLCVCISLMEKCQIFFVRSLVTIKIYQPKKQLDKNKDDVVNNGQFDLQLSSRKRRATKSTKMCNTQASG